MIQGKVAVLILLLALAGSHFLFETAYVGYLLTFALFIFIMASNIFFFEPRNSISTRPSFMWLIWALVAAVVGSVTLLEQPPLGDLFRDLGALFSFVFGFVIIPRAIKRDWARHLLPAISAAGVIISLLTFASAAKALIDGVSAYQWRGEYLPFANVWLPYLLLADYMMLEDRTEIRRGSLARLALCAAAILITLSRTGIILLALFAIITFVSRHRTILASMKGLAGLFASIVVAAVLGPLFVGLAVVRERFELSVGGGDQSLGWRALENASAIEMMNEGGWVRWIFGYGLGARMPLPPGFVDFDGNPTIPHLHNSFYTILIKSGSFGLFALFTALVWIVLRARAKRKSPWAYQWSGGLWLLLFVLGYAVTQQGLSQWSHLVFFGISCAMLLDRHDWRHTYLEFKQRLPDRKSL